VPLLLKRFIPYELLVVEESRPYIGVLRFAAVTSAKFGLHTQKNVAYPVKDADSSPVAIASFAPSKVSAAFPPITPL
jgi:hypothetical protein